MAHGIARILSVFFFYLPISDHGETASVREGRAHSLQRPRDEEDGVAPAAGEDQGGEEHHDQTEHHREVVPDPVDDVAAQRVDEYLGQSENRGWPWCQVRLCAGAGGGRLVRDGGG